MVNKEITAFRTHNVHIPQISLAHFIDQTKKRHDLHYKYSPAKNYKCRLDIEKFEKILNNLILNAFKYTGKRGEVGLTISKEGHFFYFSVHDTGKGIAPRERAKLFDRYYQSEVSANHTGGGTGIGLTLALEYARLMGGDIEVKSEAGKGSSFIVKLPLDGVEQIQLTGP
jgi:signal transduction histidine kinase